jgi:predicted nucleic acid-binding protein
VTNTLFEKAVFIDTSAFIELEINNKEAISCKNQIDQLSIPTYTTRLIIAETHKRLLFDHGNQKAFSFIANFLTSNIIVLNHDSTVDVSARDLILQYWDLDLTFCDAVSSVVMMNSGIYKTFTYDSHFQALGFVKIPPYY